MKSKEELAALKEEFEALNKKLAELSEEELELVSGGINGNTKILCDSGAYLVGDCGAEDGKKPDGWPYSRETLGDSGPYLVGDCGAEDGSKGPIRR